MFPSIPQPANFGLDGGLRPRARAVAAFWNIAYILASLATGGFLMWLPWQSFWEHNYLVFRYPRIQPIIADPFFKGAIVGLGINNILLGIYQIVRFKKDTKGPFLR
jgi:hypothetical protein